MLRLSTSQIGKLNEVGFDEFVKIIRLSVIQNLEVDTVELKELSSVIREVYDEFNITEESLIEEYCLLFYNFPVLRQRPLDDSIKPVLKSRTKRARQKIDELSEFLIFNSR